MRSRYRVIILRQTTIARQCDVVIAAVDEVNINQFFLFFIFEFFVCAMFDMRKLKLIDSFRRCHKQKFK